eukprot:m.263757 g.263757  ORF g.263757 m.263757 type:complete len:86 (-) comp27207_c1_seq1:28-285(-)
MCGNMRTTLTTATTAANTLKLGGASSTGSSLREIWFESLFLVICDMSGLGYCDARKSFLGQQKEQYKWKPSLFVWKETPRKTGRK